MGGRGRGGGLVYWHKTQGWMPCCRWALPLAAIAPRVTPAVRCARRCA